MIRLTWETGNFDTVNLVLGSNLDLLELIQNIKFGQVETGVTVDHGRVLHDDQVEPTATSSSTSDDTVLGSDLLQSLSNGVELLRGERSTTDSGGVGLDDTNDLLDGEGRDTQTGNDTTDRGSRRGDVGVRSVVNVEHERVGTFHEDSLARSEGLVHEGRAIDNVGSKSLSKGLR